MRTLAIETASEACSVALFEGSSLMAFDHRVLGRGHAEALIPMIAALPERGKAERILVSLGPGSFTGVRIGIAAARALGVAWSAQVLGYPTLALIAQMAGDSEGVTVCMNGGHGEWFVQNFHQGIAIDNVQSLTPEAATSQARYPNAAGNRAEDIAAISPSVTTGLNLLPDARSTIELAETVLAHDLSPIYGRAPDAMPQKVKPA